MKVTIINTTQKFIECESQSNYGYTRLLTKYKYKTEYPVVVNLEPSDGTESAKNFCFEVGNKLFPAPSSVTEAGSDPSKGTTIECFFEVSHPISYEKPQCSFKIKFSTGAFRGLWEIYEEKLRYNVEMKFDNNEKIILKDAKGDFQSWNVLFIAWPIAFFKNKTETEVFIKVEVEIEDPIFALSVFPNPSSMNKNILLDQIQCDFKIIAEDSKNSEIPCHKVFLAAGSQVFAAMFGTDCQETRSGTIKMPISKEGADAFLKFLYYFNIEAPCHSPNIAMDLLELGHKYNIEHLETEMKKIIEVNFNGYYSVDNAIRLYKWCQDHDHEDLKKKAVEVIKSKGDQLLGSPRFHQLFPNEAEAKLFIDDMCRCSLNDASGGLL